MQAFDSVDAVAAALDARDYLAGRALATTVFLALRMQRPLFLEGEAGVGKTELAKALAALAGTDLLRLQCYEGLDSAQALYDWNYARQLLEIRLAESRGGGAVDALASELYGERFLMRRPLLEALLPEANGPRVLLIDELDRADEPFDAFLLEVLADFQVSIPEYGVIRAATPPIVVITPQIPPRNHGEPRPVKDPSSESASAKPMEMPAPMDAASPTRKVDQLLCVANAAAKSGASVETEPSIKPARPG